MVAVVIPARYASTRLPGKPLSDINGRPMVAHVRACACAAASVTRVIVATDDARIQQVVEREGGEVRMTASRHRTGTERVAEVARTLSEDIVVNLQGDEPLIPAAALEAVIAPFQERPEVQITTLRRRMTDPSERDNPHAVKVVTAATGEALYFSRAPIPAHFAATESLAGPEYIHVGIYAFRRAVLLDLVALSPSPLERQEGLEQLRWLEHGYRIHVATTDYPGRSVDTPEDLEWVRGEMARRTKPS